MYQNFLSVAMATGSCFLFNGSSEGQNIQLEKSDLWRTRRRFAQGSKIPVHQFKHARMGSRCTRTPWRTGPDLTGFCIPRELSNVMHYTTHTCFPYKLCFFSINGFITQMFWGIPNYQRNIYLRSSSMKTSFTQITISSRKQTKYFHFRALPKHAAWTPYNRCWQK